MREKYGKQTKKTFEALVLVFYARQSIFFSKGEDEDNPQVKISYESGTG